jgi:hypothetical protein
MKIVNVFAVIVAVLALVWQPRPNEHHHASARDATYRRCPSLRRRPAPRARARAGTGAAAAAGGTHRFLCALVGPDATASNAPASEEEETDVTFNDVALTDAITPLALQAGQNIVFDPLFWWRRRPSHCAAAGDREMAQNHRHSGPARLAG